MGIGDKSKTAKRVAPVRFKSTLPVDWTQWHATSSVTLGEAVRFAAFSTDLSHTTSSVQRGKRVTPLIAAPLVAMADAAARRKSSLWIQEKGNRTWSIILGVGHGISGKTYIDWEIQVAVDTAGNVQITTPLYLSENGVLANGNIHDLIRENVKTALAEEGPALADPESRLSKWSLSTSLVDDLLEPLGKVDDKFSVSSSLAESELRKRLDNWVGLPVIQRSENTWRYGFGLPNMWLENWGELELSEMNPALLSGVISLAGTESRAHQVMAFQGVRTLLARLQRTLALNDPNLKIAPPSRIPVI